MPSERSLCLETAKTVAQRGHVDEAIKLYERAEELDPNAAPMDTELAPLYANAGNFPAAIDRYQRRTSDAPKDRELSNNFAWTLMEAGQFDRAVSEATRGLQHHPDDDRLHSTLAMIYYRQGDRSNSFSHFEKAGGATAAHHNLAILDIDAGKLQSAKEQAELAKQLAETVPPSKKDADIESLVSALQSQLQE